MILGTLNKQIVVIVIFFQTKVALMVKVVIKLPKTLVRKLSKPSSNSI